MSSPQKPGMASVDAAILDRILAVLAPKKLAPHKKIVPLLRVNKHWNAIGRKRLYAAISLKGQWISRPLRRTLDKSPALAALVTELVMDTELSSQDPKETADHIRIVAACQNLQHLTILGYASTADVAKYREAIASRSSLITLNISEGNGMFTFAQLLDMLAGWPKLEKLILKDTLLPAPDDGALPVMSASQCHSLKMVKIIDTLDPAQRFSFAAFASRVPALSVLWVQPQRQMPDDILDGLRAWSATLEALCLLSDSELHLETILPSLSSLKHLDTWSQMLSPASIKHAPPSVEALTYRIFPAQLLDLSETLAISTVLPSLKALEVKGAVPPGKITPLKFTPMATQSIRTVCKRRRIRLTM
ncbi:hypothetical protein R3P38DRAFT_1733932 [Favolaschia claudopus]|uniref:Uncharacterized protein n=1 Tax=Favolaschia claudopus TaxID=2862362 RepID=A0AAW0A8N9_9AGAR